MQRSEFFAILDHFLPFDPPHNQKYQHFLKIKKSAGDIIILNLSTTNDSHMIHGSWDMKCNRQNLLVILGHFLPFYPLNSLKNENIIKMKKMPGDVTYEIVIFHFELFFWPFTHTSHPHPPNRQKNENFKKKEKSAWKYHHFTQVYLKLWSYAMLFLRYDTWHV